MCIRDRGNAVSRKLVYFNAASTGYFETMRTPLLAGRDFSDSDTPASPLVAIVNESFARTFFPDGNLIGRTFGKRDLEGKPDQVYRIIGVVGDTKYQDLRQDFIPIIYVACYQIADPGTDSTFLLQSSEAPASLIASLKRTAAESSPGTVSYTHLDVYKRQVGEPSVQREPTRSGGVRVGAGGDDDHRYRCVPAAGVAGDAD